MTAKGYGFTALTGGGAGALDAIDGSILVAGDFAFGGSAASTLGATFVVVASGATDDGITVITPLVNAGTKRWHLVREQTKDGVDIYDGTNIGHLQFTSNELELYSEKHSGVVKVMVEDAAGNKETAVKATGAGAVELYHDNSKKIETTTAGVTVTGGVIETVPTFARKNHIINGGMTVAQRGASFTSATTPANSDDTYLLDRWILLSDGNDIVDVTQTTTVPTTGFSKSIGLDVETTNKKFGIFQVLENRDSLSIIGSTVTLSFYAKVSATTKLDNIKAAIVSWSSTADTVTSDIVSAWENEGTAPTLAANWTYENVPANLGVTTSFVKYSISAAIDTASTANIGVFIWSDVTDTTAGDFLYITGVQLEVGGYATPFEFRHHGEELALCQRYYFRNIPSGSSTCFCSGYADSTTSFRAIESFPVPMRIAPTAIEQSGTATDYAVRVGGTATACSSVPVFQLASVYKGSVAFIVAAGLTAGDAGEARINGATAGFLGWSTEL